MQLQRTWWNLCEAIEALVKWLIKRYTTKCGAYNCVHFRLMQRVTSFNGIVYAVHHSQAMTKHQIRH